jgi:hypothetical protein
MSGVRLACVYIDVRCVSTNECEKEREECSIERESSE